MAEEILSFGENGQLIGILSSPKSIDPTKPAVIILNSGALHRVGACRMAVLLARHLSEHGHYAFRFDFSGIGDSGFGGDTSDNPLEARSEVKEAIDTLSAKTGCTRFILHGLCSGARDALAASLVDDRIVGLSMIDGYAFRTTRYHLKKLPGFLLNPAAWINFIRVRLKADDSEVKTGIPNEILELPFWPDYPPKPEVENAFRKIAARNVRILATYTGSWSDEYNHEGQFFDMFSGVNFGDNVTVNFMPQASHVMTDFASQKSFRNAVLAFVKELK
jgi:hypothetical protein